MLKDSARRVRADGRPTIARRALRLDPLIDAIATLTVEAPVAGEAALPHVPGSNRAGTKPFYIEGLNCESGEWESIRQFIYDVESASEFVIIDDVTLSQNDAGKPLTLTLELSTYFRLGSNGN